MPSHGSFATVRRRTDADEGSLFYLVGSSTVAADRLLDYARTRLDETQPITLAHCYVTSPVRVIGNRNVTLSPAEFALRKRRGLFVLDWESNGLRYAIGSEINYWLAKGLSVVVSGSRPLVGRALELYPRMTVVWIGSEESVGAAPREWSSPALPEARSERGASVVSVAAGAYRAAYIDHGTLPGAGERLLSILLSEYER